MTTRPRRWFSKRRLAELKAQAAALKKLKAPRDKRRLMIRLERNPKAKAFVHFLRKNDIQMWTRFFGGNYDKRHYAIGSLAEKYPRKSVPFLEVLCSDPSFDVRFHAIERLEEVHKKSAEKMALVLLKDKHPYVRSTAGFVLQNLMKKRAIPFLERQLTDPDPTVRESAIVRLEKLQSRRSIPLIKQLINDPKTIVRVEAISALAKLDQDDPRHGPLYQQVAYREPRDFFHEEHAVRRADFEKTAGQSLSNSTGSLIVLGGKQWGKSIVRIVDEEAFNAWKRAQEKGIRVEPILTKKDGSLRAKHVGKGKVRVFAGVVGPTITEFLDQRRNKKYERSVRNQVQTIQRQLLRHNINHGHSIDGVNITQGNLCVRFETYRGKKRPRVYVIDFDRARIQFP
jgi:hypothetical protein